MRGWKLVCVVLACAALAAWASSRSHYVSISSNSGWATMDGIAKAFQPYCDSA
jgi:hypothetical protein